MRPRRFADAPARMTGLTRVRFGFLSEGYPRIFCLISENRRAPVGKHDTEQIGLPQIPRTDETLSATSSTNTLRRYLVDHTK